MKFRLVLGLVGAVGIVGLLWWSRDARGGRERDALPPAPAAEPEPAVELVEGRPPDAESEPATSAQAERTEVEPAPAAPAPAAQPALAEIRGRFVLEGGAPAAGVRCEVHGWGANQERRMKYGLPEDWSDPSGETDADGRLSIRFDPPRAFQFTLEGKVPGYAGAEWRWGEIEPGAVVELGEITLVRGGTLEGRIVDRAGNALVGQEWLVYARTRPTNGGRGRDETQVIAFVDPATAHYRAEDVMPGKVELQAHSDMANWIDGPPVTLATGERLEVDIVYDGPDNSRRITVTTVTRPFYVPFHEPGVIEPEHVKLLLPGGEVRTAAKTSGGSQQYTSIQAGDTRYFQFWHRDTSAGGAMFNASDALRVTFCQ